MSANQLSDTSSKVRSDLRLGMVQGLLSEFITSQQSTLWILLLVSLGASVAAVASPYFFASLIDHAKNRPEEVLFLGFLGYATLLAISNFLQATTQYLSFSTAEVLGFIVGKEFFARLLRKNSAFYVEHNPAEIQQAIAQGRQSLTILLQLLLIVILPGLTQISLALFILGALIDIQTMLIVALYGALFIATTWFANLRTKRFLETAVSSGQVNSRFIGNTILAMETLRQFGSHRWMTGKYVEQAKRARDNWRAFAHRRIGFSLVLVIGLLTQLAFAFYFLVPRYQKGEISIGDVVLFNGLLLLLNRPFEMIGQAVDDVVRSFTSLSPLASMWFAPEEAADQANATIHSSTTGAVSFEGVTYRYDAGRGVSGFNFAAHRGRLNFLLGETGSGKSTVLKLLLKTLEPQAGRILFDGRDLRMIERFEWHRTVAVVPQEVVLMNETIADNILLGRERSEAKLAVALKKAQAQELIDALPEGLETVVGERGLKLSGGERQRIAIARALYDQPAVLVLDEASSALDEQVEGLVMEHIRNICSSVTVIAVTHRKGIIRPEDNVVEL
ncbi:ABC transporter ATP-binding protein [Agrobacterium cavarae]|uniref:ABC transporter ATP-binding protein n=1 Tax=Agrobacterium cavarae TaxID=2528239 RepID=UPI003FD0F3A6